MIRCRHYLILAPEGGCICAWCRQPLDYSDDRPIFTVDRPSRAEQQESGALNREAHDRYGGK